MQYVLPALIISIAILITGLLLRKNLRSRTPGNESESALSLLQNQANANFQQTLQQVEIMRNSLNEAMRSLSGQVSQALSDTNRDVGARLDNAAKVMGNVHNQLGRLGESTRRMEELGKDISRLEDILQPPKLRGALGELFLTDLLAQVLPPSHYTLQHQFKGGETVDAVIVLRSGMVPIDAKFPLENFKRTLNCQNDTERKNAKKAFARDVKTHIDNIAAKYIRMDENTFDFALMYIPAENVYYETIIKETEFDTQPPIFAYALKKRVIPVSPNSFYAYLQTIILGLKGMRVEEKSREMLENLSRLHKEFDNFSEAFRLVGQHLDNSSKKYAEAEKRFSKMEAKVEQIDGLARDLELPHPSGTETAVLPAPDDTDNPSDTPPGRTVAGPRGAV